MATNKLKDTLIKQGIKQVELAKESGISEGTINKLANNKRTPAPTTMNRIVKALNKLSSVSYKVEEIFPDYSVDGDDEQER